jgi:hypothetical protein
MPVLASQPTVHALARTPSGLSAEIRMAEIFAAVPGA